MPDTIVAPLLEATLTAGFMYLLLFSIVGLIKPERYLDEDLELEEESPKISKSKVKFIPCRDTYLEESYVIEGEKDRFRSCEDPLFK